MVCILANIVAQSCSVPTAVMAAANAKELAEAIEPRCSDAGASHAVMQIHWARLTQTASSTATLWVEDQHTWYARSLKTHDMSNWS